MSVEILTLLMFATLVVAICLGHPLAVTLMTVAVVFGLIDNGWNVPALLDLLANNNWGVMQNYVLVAIPLFVFMAQVLDRSKVSEGLFDALYVVLGRLRGGLGLAAILVSTIFAATTGIIGASVVAMGLMAGSALIRKGYDKGLVSGIICASGTLGILIPPSIMIVVYAGLTGLKETTVGNMFAGAILPGLLLSALFMIYTWLMCTVKPEMGPPISDEEAGRFTTAQKWGMTLKSFVPPFALILLVMGTILAGVATATEAAGMGCVGALVLAAFSRKFTWPVIRDASLATLRTTCMVMLLFLGGKAFSVVFLSMGGGDVVSDLLLGLGNRWAALGIMMLIVFILGMFIDWAAILLVTVPVFTPIAMDLDFNPLWFSLLMCVNLQASFLTPPFGYALFYFKGVAPPEVSMLDIYKGIIPFVVLQGIGLLLCALFPEIVLWLPAKLFGAG